MTSKKKTETPTPPQPVTETKRVLDKVVRLNEAENDLILFCRALKIDPEKVRDDLMAAWLKKHQPAAPAAKKPAAKKPAAKKPAAKKPADPAAPAPEQVEEQPQA
jgi:hypothetical protein